jgi:hypothetical protein
MKLVVNRNEFVKLKPRAKEKLKRLTKKTYSWLIKNVMKLP